MVYRDDWDDGRWDDDGYDNEPPPCHECGAPYDEEHDWQCSYAPLPKTRTQRLRAWWNERIYYRRFITPSVYDLHQWLKRRFSKPPPPIDDDDLPF